MSQQSWVCICTNRPSTSAVSAAATAAGGGGSGGGSLLLLNPITGTLQSSLRIVGDNASRGPGIGIHSLSLFPVTSARAHDPTKLALAFGSTVGKSDDSYAMLLSLRRAAASTSSSLSSSSSTTAPSTSSTATSASSLPPILNWKCRCPEPNMTAGWLVSPCSHYIVGGGSTGTLYVFQSMGGRLLTSFSAHYRSVRVMAWSTSSSSSSSSSSAPSSSLANVCLVTGGDDGMIHLYSLAELVRQTNTSTATTTQSKQRPLSSWSKHTLPVTALASLPGGRMVSGSQDGQVLVLELFSNSILATLQVPSAVTSLVTALSSSSSSDGGGGQQLLVGCQSGTIHIIDLDQYAIYQTQSKTGATIVTNAGAVPQYGGASSNNNATNNTDSNNNLATTTMTATGESASYGSELRGHDRAVTALAVVHTVGGGGDDNTSEQQQEQASLLLVSGDERGTVRIWDIPGRVCLRILTPWSTTTASATTTSSDTSNHPVTSLSVWYEIDEENGGSASNSLFQLHQQQNNNGSRAQYSKHGIGTGSGGGVSGGGAGWSKWLTPLQKFASQQPWSEQVTIPIPQPRWRKRSTDDMIGRQTQEGLLQAILYSRRQHHHQQQQQNQLEDNEDDQEGSNNNNNNEELKRVKRELEEAKETIARWEAVNNKLMAKLKK